ncbi:hypothetical protein BDV24DRAFT_156900 [Aspergillus arachidicola]|uniref:Uncharacterized protein n=1 Tax=Aspergillus arachidicola TaxID=656916 RepID=A0A5N6XN48_9EURO|nr:hypothetical protein BDV24DRAFT_156900 [Aspergillus arachidicola]
MAYRMEANALYIHEKWLHVRGADGPATEGAIRSERDLYRRAVTLIVHKTDGPRTSQTIQPLLQAAHWKLHEMPRRIEVYAAADDGTRATQVSFYTGHSLLFTKLCGTQVSYLVVLHGPNCVAQSVDHLLYDPSRDCCLCPRQVVPLSMRRAVFEDPGHGPWVPMVVKMSVRDGLVGAMSSPGGYHWPLLPKAQDGALVAIAPPSHSPSSETAAPRGTVPVDRPPTVSAALDPVLTTPTAASQEDQETIAASQLAAGPLELGTGTQTTASDTAAPVPLVSVVECLAPHPDDNPESASNALPSTISRNMTSADGAWWQAWPEPPRDVQTSPSAADHNIGRFQVSSPLLYHVLHHRCPSSISFFPVLSMKSRRSRNHIGHASHPRASRKGNTLGSSSVSRAGMAPRPVGTSSTSTMFCRRPRRMIRVPVSSSRNTRSWPTG